MTWVLCQVGSLSVVESPSGVSPRDSDQRRPAKRPQVADVELRDNINYNIIGRYVERYKDNA
jgi:hypothetical protein